MYGFYRPESQKALKVAFAGSVESANYKLIEVLMQQYKVLSLIDDTVLLKAVEGAAYDGEFVLLKELLFFVLASFDSSKSIRSRGRSSSTSARTRSTRCSPTSGTNTAKTFYCHKC